MITPALEAHLAGRQFGEPFPINRVGEHARERMGMRIADVRAFVVSAGVADATKTAAAGGYMRIEHFANCIAKVKVCKTDDACSNTRLAVLS